MSALCMQGAASGLEHIWKESIMRAQKPLLPLSAPQLIYSISCDCYYIEISLLPYIKVCDEEFMIPWIFSERFLKAQQHLVWSSNLIKPRREISPILDNCHNFDNGRPLNRTKVAANTFSV